MKHNAFLALCILLSASLFAQTTEKYSRVDIDLKGKDIHTLTRLGIETDHGLFSPGRSLITDLAASEIALVQNAGFQTKTIIPDLKKDYLDRLQNPAVENRSGSCSESAPVYPIPTNYTYGSMGGYHTLEEMMAVLDDMHAKFPNLISARADVSDTIETWENRKLQYVKISDNPDLNEAEPEVLYNSLHHAREPNGASQLLFFMWYLLENYDTDPEIQYILNNAELYFIPCVNPDGYVYNETTDPQGGGFWRKNRRDNGDGSYGVDLNRNYGYFWGNDDSGSSPNTQSQTYRGPEAFSEPETRSMRDFVREHDFVIAQNYHTFGNLLIYPWAYNNELADTSLYILGHLFSRENHFKTGTSIETVGYNVNGNSDDWMYAEGGAHSFTPEVGTTGFWPQPNEIDNLNRLNVWQNMSTALCALRFGELTDKSQDYYSVLNPSISLEVIRYGFENGPFLVNIAPLSANILGVTPASQSADIQQFETKTLEFGLELASSIQVGESFSYVVTFSNGFYAKSDTFQKFYGGIAIPIFSENGTDISEWEGDWGLTQTTFVSAPSSITDSPGVDYEGNTYSELKLSNPGVLIPANATQPQLRFWAKWDLEPNYDYVQVRGQGFTDQALCGRYTKPGANGVQPNGEPVFDGLQEAWVEECMDLSDFIGQMVDLIFIFGSDNGDERDGFYFDDLRVEYIDPTVLRTVSIALEDFKLLQNQPNPSAETTIIQWENARQFHGAASLIV